MNIYNKHCHYWSINLNDKWQSLDYKSLIIKIQTYKNREKHDKNFSAMCDENSFFKFIQRQSALKSKKVLFGIYSKGKIKFTNGSALN